MSDLARVYPPGKELAVPTSTLNVVEVSGQEKATVKNAGLARDYRDDRTK